jgi:mannose-6-phosphate isomerase-like protein (cupin superfamily)
MKASLAETLNKLPLPPTDKWPNGVWHSLALRHGSMAVLVFAPKGKDLQSPHNQDEIYIVMGGSGEFVMEGQRTACNLGDVLFVPANAAHHFENLSDDFVTWAIFWGPEGGETAA